MHITCGVDTTSTPQQDAFQACPPDGRRIGTSLRAPKGLQLAPTVHWPEETSVHSLGERWKDTSD
ncbi:hypothetical protein PHLCEN_2v4831 [Hermanssonia centrifuga]|uniref:Uncharacterized protein n=1 Tax=Hermanssonia centrifuga TaxID=98765 RepID=A0A2R6PG52_9APHY|nr:hypothetical protein PHLCEN_2v4831 [Hermanssonia centrifuga]